MFTASLDWARLAASESPRSLFRNTSSQDLSLEVVTQKVLVVSEVSFQKAAKVILKSSCIREPLSHMAFQASIQVPNSTSPLLFPVCNLEKQAMSLRLAEIEIIIYFSAGQFPDLEPADCILVLSVEAMQWCLRISQAAGPLADHWMASLAFLFCEFPAQNSQLLLECSCGLLPVSVLTTMKYNQWSPPSPLTSRDVISDPGRPYVNVQNRNFLR